MTRGSGILLHVTALPGEGGVGCLNAEAHRFVDFLAASGQRYWQILPLNPTGAESGHSPYSSISAFAGNPLLISVEDLCAEGWLEASEARPPRTIPAGKASYRRALGYRERALRVAFRRFTDSPQPDFERFCSDESWWLDDYSLFAALRRRFCGRSWLEWPPQLRDRKPEALRDAAHELDDERRYERFVQWVFWKQWSALRRTCRERGVLIIGDVPIYVRLDSSDVWAHRDIFKLDRRGRPLRVAGVPPDYFSETGQLWGNPVYRWDVLAERDFLWWQQRLERSFELCDLVRLDHFRGFVACWEVPARARTAKPGKWVEGPGIDLFRALERRFPGLPLIAEDLGVITADVRELIARLELPGIRVLQFGFGDDAAKSLHAPHRHERRSLVCPGTHDNNTARGWFESEASPAQRQRLERYLGRRLTPGAAADALVRLTMMSVADLAVVPLQDLLRLGEAARFNRPSVARGNWTWRMRGRDLTDTLAERLRNLSELYGRV